MEEFFNIIRSYGVDTVVLALIINVLTGFVKIPMKRLSLKLAPKGMSLNKYITLLPIVLGFGIAALATGLVFEPGVFWNSRTPVLALTASSLSLSIYAICEKFFASTSRSVGTETLKDDPAKEEKEGDSSEPASNLENGKDQELTKSVFKIGGGNRHEDSTESK